jgi:hypothetical protein
MLLNTPGIFACHVSCAPAFCGRSGFGLGCSARLAGASSRDATALVCPRPTGMRVLSPTDQSVRVCAGTK